MDTSGNDHRTDPSWRRPAAAALATIGLVVLALVVVGAATAIEQRANPPTCFGIGFGCTPDAFAATIFVAWFVGAPVVAVAWLLNVVGWALTRRREDRVNRWATWWPTWLLGSGLVLLVMIAVVTAGR